MDCSQTLTSHILTPTMYQETLEDTIEDIFKNIAKKLDLPPRSLTRRQGVQVAVKEFYSPPRRSHSRRATKGKLPMPGDL